MNVPERKQDNKKVEPKQESIMTKISNRIKKVLVKREKKETRRMWLFDHNEEFQRNRPRQKKRAARLAYKKARKLYFAAVR